MQKWSPRLAAKWSLERLDRIDNALLEIASAWGDVDEYLIRRCDEMRRDVEQFKEEVGESVTHQLELLREPVDA